MNNIKKIQATIILILSLTLLTSTKSFAITRDKDGLTALHIAAGYGDLQRVIELVQSRADLYTLDSKMGVSVLHKAVYSGNANVVAYLLDRGALIDVQSPSNGNTALHDALYFKPGSDTRVIKAILAHKPNLALRNRAGLTPKKSATLLKDQESVHLIETYEKTLFSETGRELMKFVKLNDFEKVVQLTNDPKRALDEADEQGFTPLIWAAREGFVEITSLLLNKGANPNHLDQWMKANAGHKAAFWGRAEVMRRLIAGGLDINARGGYNGYTALHDAVARNHVEVVQILVNASARKDIKGHDGKTAYDLAIASGNENILAILNE